MYSRICQLQRLPAYPGSPGHNPESRKTVVLVIVVVVASTGKEMSEYEYVSFSSVEVCIVQLAPDYTVVQ